MQLLRMLVEMSGMFAADAPLRWRLSLQGHLLLSLEISLTGPKLHLGQI